MEIVEERDKIIHEIYYNKNGFGSITNTYKQAHEEDKAISMKYVKYWFNRNIEKTAQVRGMNSFAAPHPNFEYQIDLCFFADLENQDFKVGMICIDVFTKYAVVVALKSKNEGDVAAGILECINRMFKKPKLIYTDDEKSFSTTAIQKYFIDNKISHYITKHHAAFGERFIRTFKNMLYKRIDNDIKAEVYINPQWKDYIEDIMINYNYKNKHSSINMTPDNARRATNQLEVKTQLELIASRTRRYPEIEINDNVKIYFKKKFQKERVSTFSKEIYKVINISESLNQLYYKVEGIERSYLRFELLKV